MFRCFISIFHFQNLGASFPLRYSISAGGDFRSSILIVSLLHLYISALYYSISAAIHFLHSIIECSAASFPYFQRSRIIIVILICNFILSEIVLIIECLAASFLYFCAPNNTADNMNVSLLHFLFSAPNYSISI